MTIADLHAFTLAGMRAAEHRWQRTRAQLFPELASVPYYAVPERAVIELPTEDTIKRTKEAL